MRVRNNSQGSDSAKPISEAPLGFTVSQPSALLTLSGENELALL